MTPADVWAACMHADSMRGKPVQPLTCVLRPLRTEAKNTVFWRAHRKRSYRGDSNPRPWK